MKRLILLPVFLMIFPLIMLANTPGDSVEYEVTGKITYKSGTVVKIQNTSKTAMPVIGQEGVLSKSFETELFGGTATGWMSIGSMKVTAIAGDIITFSLLKELSVVTENGVKKNHFVIDKEVKFEWKELVSPEEAAYEKGQDIVNTDIEQALVYYRQAVALNPSHAKSLNMIGMILTEKEQGDSAYVYFKKAADTDLHNAQYEKNVAISAFNAGNTAVAYEYADKATKSDSKDGEAYYLRGLMNYLLNKAQLDDAIKQKVLLDLDKAIELTPEESFYYSERAFLRKEFGNLAGACEDAKKAKLQGAENGDELIQTYCQ